MSFIKRSSSTLVLKTLTLGFFGLIVCRNIAAFIMQKLKSVEWFCFPGRVSNSPSWLTFLSFHGDHEQAEARQLPEVQGSDGVPVNTAADSEKMVGKTMPWVPPNSGSARTIKKSVSINEIVEEIIPSTKRNRKMYGLDNEDVKPLKSILKVGSRVGEKQ